jgi:hypothetical protein
VRAAGTWVIRGGSLPPGLSVEVQDADGLLAASLGQLDDGADLIKLYLDGPDADIAPWSAAEVRRVVDAVHAPGGGPSPRTARDWPTAGSRRRRPSTRSSTGSRSTPASRGYSRPTR